MSVVISEVEHVPSGDTGTEGATSASSHSQARSIGIDEVLAMLRREKSRQARLWAD